MKFVPIVVKDESDEDALTNAVLVGARKPKLVYIAMISDEDALTKACEDGHLLFEREAFTAADALQFSHVRFIGKEGEQHPLPMGGGVTYTLADLLQQAKSKCAYYEDIYCRREKRRTK